MAPAADVYALGILLAELATGRVPTPDAVPSGSPVQRDAAVGRLPEALRRFVLRCTDRDPARRPPDARQALDEFEAVLGAVGPAAAGG